MDKGRGGPRASGRSSRGTGGSLFDARETVYLADSVRGSLQDEGVNKMPSNYVLAQADRNTAASSNGAGRDTIYTTADGQRSTIGDRKERYTEGDGRTGHQTGGGRSTLYFRQGDMYTGVYEDADAAPDVKEKFAGVGEDWRAQQARWASRENGNGEEEGGEGGGAGRRAAAASGQRVDAHVNGGVGTRGSRDTDSRDSTRSVVSSGVKGGRRKPGQNPALPPSMSSVKDLYESQQKQQEDKLSGRRFLDPAKRLAQIESLEEKKEPVVQPGRSEYKGSRIEWEKFPEVSSNWYEHYEELEELLERLQVDLSSGFNDAIVQNRLKSMGKNKIFISQEGYESFPSFNNVPTIATALRDGRIKEIAAEDLVPGDIVFIEAGKRIPADCRLIEASPELAVEMCTIGFPPPDKREMGYPRDAQQVEETVGPWECKNLVFMGCKCERGKGKGIVIKTGHACALGVLAKEMEWTVAVKNDKFNSKVAKMEIAFEGTIESFARRIGFADKEGRCRCAIM